MCGKTERRTKNKEEERRSVPSKHKETTAVRCPKQPVVDNEGYEIVYNKSGKRTEAKHKPKTTSRCPRTVQSATIAKSNRFDCFREEPPVVADNDVQFAEHCNLSDELVQQQHSILTLQQRKNSCNRQQTDEDSHNINDTKSRKREMARMRQHKSRQGENVEQTNARRQKVLESVRKRLMDESVEQTIDRRRKTLDSVRKRLRLETAEQRIQRRRKVLDSVRKRLRYENESEKYLRQEKSLRNVRNRRKNESGVQRMKRLDCCRRRMSEMRQKVCIRKVRRQIPRYCIRLQMLVNERLKRVSSVLTSAERSLKSAQHVHMKTLRQKWQHKKRTDAYWKTVNVAGVKFRNALKTGLCCICVSCHRLLYRRSVRKFNSQNYSRRAHVMFDATLQSLPEHCDRQHICFTCHATLKRGRLPAQSKANGLHLHTIPDELQNLSTLERHIISRRIPFMKLLSLPRGKQLAIHGPAVNVPTAVVPIMSVLPRNAADDSFLPLKLKRKLTFRRHYMYGNTNVQRVNSALNWLMSNNQLYADVSLSHDWQQSWNDLENGENEGNNIVSIQQNELSSVNVPENDQDRAEGDDAQDGAMLDDECETTDLRGIPFDTCLQLEDDDDSSEKIVSVAPGEGQRPLGILEDKCFEEMAFPDKFPLGSGGLASTDRDVMLTPRQYFNQRILDCDGRFGKDTDYVFAAQYAIENKQVRDNVNVMLRQTRGGSVDGKKITASLVRDVDRIKSFVRDDHAFRCLTTVRGSPAYWKRASLDLLAMIRQLGIPTWFMTLSAADLQWPDVIQTVAQQYGEILSAEQISNMSWEEKCSYIRRNPVSVARHFDFRLKTFFNVFLKSHAQLHIQWDK